jgi:hypothetical protein
VLYVSVCVSYSSVLYSVSIRAQNLNRAVLGTGVLDLKILGYSSLTLCLFRWQLARLVIVRPDVGAFMQFCK